MCQVLHGFIALELFPCKRSHLLASAGFRDLVRRSDNGAVEGKHALTLEEMVEVEEGFAGDAGRRSWGKDGGEGARLRESTSGEHSSCW